MYAVCVCGSPTFRYALAHHKPEPITTLPPGKTKKRPGGKGWRTLLSLATVCTETDVRSDWTAAHSRAACRNQTLLLICFCEALTHTQHKHTNTLPKSFLKTFSVLKVSSSLFLNCIAQWLLGHFWSDVNEERPLGSAMQDYLLLLIDNL